MLKRLRPDEEPEYVGNIFGWRLSLLGLVLIVGLAALAAYRHHSLDVPSGFDDPLKEMKTPFDDRPMRGDTTTTLPDSL